MNNTSGFTKHTLLPAVASALLTYSLLSINSNESDQRQQIFMLENEVLELEQLLTQQDQLLYTPHAIDSLPTEQQVAESTINFAPITPQSTDTPEQQDSGTTPSDRNQLLKILSTQSDRDPRNFSDKANDLLSANPGQESIAIISKGMLDLADNHNLLPDYTLELIYQNHTYSDLKRVAAQVLSIRGDNRLLDKQVVAVQSRLDSASPDVRQQALVELAKTRYAGAANAIAPLLQDNNIGVKLDALLALRATGNQGHIHWVTPLRNDPDPAIKWLANDVVNYLQNLSESARIKLSSNDIASEIPLMY